LKRSPPASTVRRLKSKRKVALVCAGGGVTGAVYEIGCLRAIEDLLDRSVLDFDSFVGVSGGAFVASLLANGISPAEIYSEVTAPARYPLGLAEAPLFRLGLGDVLKRMRRAPGLIGEAVASLARGESRGLSDTAVSLLELLPAGLLDNSGVQEWLARLWTERGLPDRFDALQRELFIVAVDLDSGEAVAFGEAEQRNVSVSQAVQASTALPGLYRPVRLGGRDFVDGAVKKTAHINLAIAHGADLVICINPLVPILNTKDGPIGAPIGDKGISYVLDQVLRIMLHGRMQYGMERYAAEHPEVDILLIEPSRHDTQMFDYHIMRYGARRIVAERGYRSALHTFRENRSRYARVLRKNGIALHDPARLPDTPETAPFRSASARSLGSSLDYLDGRLKAGRG